jgi:hypothetical protein
MIMKRHILIFISLGLVLSCGSRKVQKDQSSEIQKTELKEIQTKEAQSESQIKTEVLEQSHDFKITPIDNTQPMMINGKEYRNAKIESSGAVKSTKILEQKKEALKEAKKADLSQGSKIKKDHRESDRSGFNYWLLLWLIIPVLLWVIYKKFFKNIGIIDQIRIWTKDFLGRQPFF